MQQVIVPAYLAGGDPRAQSGYAGDARQWEDARRFVLEAVDGGGSFLDVGCANGHLMESLHAWAAHDGLVLEPYGVDISPQLTSLAQARLPQWADRIWIGNALTWEPPRSFDYVRTSPEYVPRHRRPDLIFHLLHHADRRLIVGPYNAPAGDDGTTRDLEARGVHLSGATDRRHRDPRVVRRLLWIDV
jgi:SAM-dependent methyltransferase